MRGSMIRTFGLVTLLALGGCQDALEDVANSAGKAERPLPDKIMTTLKAKGMTRSSPVMMRIFKEEGILEVWKRTHTGRYDLVKTYDICKWSGKLGPKIREGDKQAPEGFYHVTQGLMNPNSSYFLSFNLGFPNSYDRAHGRTGTNLMVHGACSSAGCYSMTDEQVSEIYAFARDALRGGQQYFQVQAYPFRMTPENMARHARSPHFGFWTMLKEGHDHFELTKVPPDVDVCGKRYVFNRTPQGGDFRAAAACPPMSMPANLETAYNSYQQKYALAFDKALAKADAEEAERLAAMKQAEEKAAAEKAEADAKAALEAQAAAGDQPQDGEAGAGPASDVLDVAADAAPASATDGATTAAETATPGANAGTAPVPAGAEGTVAGAPGTDPSVSAQALAPETAPAKSWWKKYNPF